MAALQAKACGSCGAVLARGRFSNKQWKTTRGRCAACIAAGQPTPSAGAPDDASPPWVALHHFPIATAHGAVGRAVRTRRDAGQLLIGVELAFPPAAVAAHPVLWADPACVRPYAADPRSAPSDARSRGAARGVARRGAELMQEALLRDILPPEDVETMFGMEHVVLDIGRLVRACWTALFRLELVSVESVTEACVAGMLPAFFDTRVSELEAAPSVYSSRATRLRAEAGRGLCLVQWDFALLSGIARTALYGVD